MAKDVTVVFMKYGIIPWQKKLTVDEITIFESDDEVKFFRDEEVVFTVTASNVTGLHVPNDWPQPFGPTTNVAFKANPDITPPSQKS